MAGDDDANRRRPIAGKRDRRARRHRHASLHRRQHRRQIGMHEKNKNVFFFFFYFGNAGIINPAPLNKRNY